MKASGELNKTVERGSFFVALGVETLREFRVLTGTAPAVFDPTVFVLPEQGTYGNAGRNIIIGSGLVNFHFALVKKTALTERMGLQFRAEGFNVFNNVNWGQPNTRIFEARGGFAATAGQITYTRTRGREFQFALKLVF